MQQRCIAAQKALVTSEKSTSECLSKIEISDWAIRQSGTSEMKRGVIDLKLPALIPRKDKDSRRACEAGSFRDEFLSEVQGEESSRDIFRVVNMDHSEDVQDLTLPSYQVRPISAFPPQIRPRSFQTWPFGLSLANSLATKSQRAIGVPYASPCFSRVLESSRCYIFRPMPSRSRKSLKTMLVKHCRRNSCFLNFEPTSQFPGVVLVRQVSLHIGKRRVTSEVIVVVLKVPVNVLY